MGCLLFVIDVLDHRQQRSSFFCWAACYDGIRACFSDTLFVVGHVGILLSRMGGETAFGAAGRTAVDDTLSDLLHFHRIRNDFSKLVEVRIGEGSIARCFFYLAACTLALVS